MTNLYLNSFTGIFLKISLVYSSDQRPSVTRIVDPTLLQAYSI